MVNKKIIWVVSPLCEPIRIYYQNSLWNVVKKFVDIVLHLKKSMILFKGNKL